MQGITREELVLMVKKVGLEVCERAEDLVGDGETLTDMDIWMRFPLNEYPRIEVTRSYMSREAIGVLTGKVEDT